jgi:transposase
MPAKRSAMRKIKDVLRLKFEARLSHEKIAAAIGLSKGAVTNAVQRALQKGLSWPLPAELDDSRLEAMLYAKAAPRSHYAQPDYALLHQELKRKGVTLQLLWEEYEAAHGEQAYRYSQFCAHYHEYRGTLARSMRQVHRAGEKVFIDYSGDTVAVIDPKSGEILTAEIFVATLGASKYAYAEATWTQTLPDWIGSNLRMLEFFGAVPSLWIPDNLKAAIKNACRYEPEATSTYEDCARHYGAAILPARPYHPKDKAAVEMSVLVVQRWILARLRNRQFFSLHELNVAIAQLLVELNRRPFKKLPGCRLDAFESIDRPAMKPLPATRYQYAEWIKAKVGIDYHMEVDRHYYSVPHSLVGEHLMVRVTDSTIECFFKGGRIAAHVRSHVKGKHTSLAEHMPSSHRKHMSWTPGRLLNWGQTIGAGTRAVVQWQLENRPHPEQGYRACLGLLNLSKTYGEQRLEAACRRALAMGSPTRKRIIAILKAKLDQHPDLFPAADTAAATASRTHGNVRGADYFRVPSTTTDVDNTTTDEGDDDSCSSNPRSIH